jgi:hypothetical protein
LTGGLHARAEPFERVKMTYKLAANSQVCPISSRCGILGSDMQGCGVARKNACACSEEDVRYALANCVWQRCIGAVCHRQHGGPMWAGCSM